jgi:tetratricopeptide (TPR) repeat protein
LEYRKLKKHLSRFLLSFAGEGQESQSKAYELHNIDAVEDKPENDIFDTGSSSDEIDIPEFTQNDIFPDDESESGTVDPINNAQESFNMGDDIDEQELSQSNEQDETNLEVAEAEAEDESELEMQKPIDIDSEIAKDKLNDDPDSFDELFNQAEDSENQEGIEKEGSEDDIERMMSAYNEEDEDEGDDKEQNQLNNEELEKQKKQQIIGSCNNLPNKIMSCQSFDCKMPNPLNKNEEISLSILQSDNKCNFTYENKPLPELKCNLSADDKTKLSASFSTFFETSKNNDFSAIDNYVSNCNEKRLAKVKKEQEKARKLAEQKKKQEEFELSKEDKAYFEMLNKKRQALPKDKQLPNSVIETIEKVTPSIAEKKENFDKKPELKNIKVSHGEKGTTPSNDEGLIRSNSGMDISMSNNSSKANEIKLTMQKAYRALLAGQTSAAVVLYNKVLNVDSDNMDALFGLATAYHKNYQYEFARDTYAKILRIEPDNKEVLNNFLVLVAEESPESALIELQKLERINSNFSPIPAQIAMIYLKLGQPEAAERYLRRAVVLSPDNITYK